MPGLTAGLNYPNAQVWVVDSASSDGTPGAIKKTYPDVKWWHCLRTGVMRAATTAGCGWPWSRELIWSSCSTTTRACIPIASQTWSGRLNEHPRAGLLGPMVYTSGGADHKLGRRPCGLAAGRCRQCWHGGGGPGTSAASDRWSLSTAPRPLARHAAIEQVGMLDERFFMYWEETDSGPCACVRPVGKSGSSQRRGCVTRRLYSIQELSPTTLYYVTRNRLLFVARHAPWPGKPLAFLRAVRGARRGIRLHKQAGRLAHAYATQAAIRHALRQRWGRANSAVFGRSLRMPSRPLTKGTEHAPSLSLAGWYPYPPDNGSKIRIFNLVRALAERHKVHLLSYASRADQPCPAGGHVAYIAGRSKQSRISRSNLAA